MIALLDRYKTVFQVMSSTTFKKRAAVAAGALVVVAGDLGSHVYSFQGTTDEPLRAFVEATRRPGPLETPALPS